jgi:hypothetical protein
VCYLDRIILEVITLEEMMPFVMTPFTNGKGGLKMVQFISILPKKTSSVIGLVLQVLEKVLQVPFCSPRNDGAKSPVIRRKRLYSETRLRLHLLKDPAFDPLPESASRSSRVGASAADCHSVLAPAGNHRPDNAGAMHWYELVSVSASFRLLTANCNCFYVLAADTVD